MIQSQRGSILLLTLVITALLLAVVAAIGLATSRRLHMARESFVLHQLKQDQQELFALALTGVIKHDHALPWSDRKEINDRETVISLSPLPLGVRCDKLWQSYSKKEIAPGAKAGLLNRSVLVSIMSQSEHLHWNTQRCVSFFQDEKDWHWSVVWYHVGLLRPVGVQ